MPIEHVMRQLQSIANYRGVTPDARDWEMLRADAEHKLRDGWTVREVVTHLRLTEELGCPLSEMEALGQMAVSFRDVKARLEREKK